MFLVNSRLGLVTATPIRFKSKFYHRSGHSFSRSYGVILPSSLTRTHSSTLGFSPHLPVSVYGTVSLNPRLEGFLGSQFRVSLCPRGSYSHLSVKDRRICLPVTPTCLNRLFRQTDDLSPLRHPITQTDQSWYGNIKPVSHRLRLSASA